MSTSNGAGTANDAAVSGDGAHGPSEVELASIAVRNAEGKVRKQKKHLEGAKQALTTAKAELAAAKKEG